MLLFFLIQLFCRRFQQIRQRFWHISDFRFDWQSLFDCTNGEICSNSWISRVLEVLRRTWNRLSGPNSRFTTDLTTFGRFDNLQESSKRVFRRRFACFSSKSTISAILARSTQLRISKAFSTFELLGSTLESRLAWLQRQNIFAHLKLNLTFAKI